MNNERMLLNRISTHRRTGTIRKIRDPNGTMLTSMLLINHGMLTMLSRLIRNIRLIKLPRLPLLTRVQPTLIVRPPITVTQSSRSKVLKRSSLITGRRNKSTLRRLSKIHTRTITMIRLHKRTRSGSIMLLLNPICMNTLINNFPYSKLRLNHPTQISLSLTTPNIRRNVTTRRLLTRLLFRRRTLLIRLITRRTIHKCKGRIQATRSH